MLMANTIMGTNVSLLLMMMILLTMMLLVRLMLIFLGHVHLHVSLLAGSPIHHNLLVTLIEHAVRIVGRYLRNRGA